MKTEAFLSIQYCHVARPISEVPPTNKIRRSDSKAFKLQPLLNGIDGEHEDNA